MLDDKSNKEHLSPVAKSSVANDLDSGKSKKRIKSEKEKSKKSSKEKVCLHASAV